MNAAFDNKLTLSEWEEKVSGVIANSYRRNLFTWPAGVGDGIIHRRYSYTLGALPKWRINGGIIAPASGNFYLITTDTDANQYISKFISGYIVQWTTIFPFTIVEDSFTVSPDEAFVYVTYDDFTNIGILLILGFYK